MIGGVFTRGAWLTISAAALSRRTAAHNSPSIVSDVTSCQLSSVAVEALDVDGWLLGEAECLFVMSPATEHYQSPRTELGPAGIAE